MEELMQRDMPVDEPGWRGALKEICSELGWKTRVQAEDERTLIICPLPADEHVSGVFFVISKVAKRLAMYVAYRKKVSSEYSTALCDTISRVNSGLLGACLELEHEHGEVRYRDGLLLAMPEVNADLLRTLVATTLRDALGYAPVVEAIADGRSPAEALASLPGD
jgi:hypothetical protein